MHVSPISLSTKNSFVNPMLRRRVLKNRLAGDMKQGELI